MAADERFMATNDYYVIIYHVLKHLYRCLKEGITPDCDWIDEFRERRGISDKYWSVILESMIEGGYIDRRCTTITARGVEHFLHNQMMQEVRRVWR